MLKKLNSIIETAVVIGGLIAAPMVVLASIESVAAASADRPAISTTLATSDAGVRTVELKF